jgi:hypothetical protein
MLNTGEVPMFQPEKRYFLLDRHDVAYLKFILEGYEGLTIMSTLERTGDQTIVSMKTLPCSAADLESLIIELRTEITLIETVPPDGGGATRKEGSHA